MHHSTPNDQSKINLDNYAGNVAGGLEGLEKFASS